MLWERWRRCALSRNAITLSPEVIALSLLRERLGDLDGARRVLDASKARPKSAWTTQLGMLLEQLEGRMGRPRSDGAELSDV